jgi:hypothetical protein
MRIVKIEVKTFEAMLSKSEDFAIMMEYLYRLHDDRKMGNLSHLPKKTPANPYHLSKNPLRYRLFCFTSQRKCKNEKYI